MIRYLKTYMLVAGCITLAMVGQAFADTHTAGVPVLSSNPSAAYTLYLDFSGFNFTGTWGSSGLTPGNTPSFDGTTGSFSLSEQNTIKNIWAMAVNSYASFNINVTTLDPAVTAGQAGTDALRQAYYDSQARMMHTVVTTSYGWYGAAGGVSYVGTTPNSYSTSANGGAGAGWHNNWVFTQGVGYGVAAGQATAHENGHGLDLIHQSNYETGKAGLTVEYSLGDNNSSPGTYAPIMGAAYYTQRGTWRNGSTDTGAFQNDPFILANDPSMGGYLNDGISHAFASATAMPLAGSSVNSVLAHGLINPLSTSNPNPIGINNYTKDYWKFTSDGVNPIALTVWDGNDLLATGVQDPSPTLRSKLNILNFNGSPYATAIESGNTLSETYSALLPAGTYIAEITSYGGHTQTLADGSGGYFDTTSYYDMGAYFMTGSGFASGLQSVGVPEPSTLSLMLLAGLWFWLAERRQKSPIHCS